MDKQQQLLDLEKQKVAAATLLMSQTQASSPTTSLSNNTIKPVTTANVKPIATSNATSVTTAVATAATSITAAAAQSFNLQSIFQNMSPEKQQQLLQQRQALQQLLQKQQVTLKKEALEAITAITAANEPDIQITGVTRQTKSNVASQPLNLSSRTVTSSSNNLLTSSSNRFSVNKSINSLTNGTAPFTSSANTSPSTAKLQEAKMKGKATVRVKTKKEVSAFGDNSDDEDEEMEVAGVNLQVFYYMCNLKCHRKC